MFQDNLQRIVRVSRYNTFLYSVCTMYMLLCDPKYLNFAELTNPKEFMTYLIIILVICGFWRQTNRARQEIERAEPSNDGGAVLSP